MLKAVELKVHFGLELGKEGLNAVHVAEEMVGIEISVGSLIVMIPF